MRNIEVCLSPELVHLFDLKGKIAVVVDVLRATSCMVTAMANGVKEIKPVCDLNVCKELQLKGFIGAAERNGVKEEGFKFGNSPFSYIDNCVQNERLAITTTNGTVAIEKSKLAEEVVIGAFLNKSAIVSYILERDMDVVVVCAGWKGQVNLEDTLFAGALIEALGEKYNHDSDAALLALNAYEKGRGNLCEYLANCNHVQRLSKMKDVGKDIEFCLQEDVYKVVPVLKGDTIVSHHCDNKVLV